MINIGVLISLIATRRFHLAKYNFGLYEVSGLGEVLFNNVASYILMLVNEPSLTF